MPKSPFNRGPFTGDNAPSDPLYRDQIHTTADETIPQPVIARSGWRPRWLTIIALMTVAAMGAMAIVVLNSPLLEIRSVTVTGTQRVSRYPSPTSERDGVSALLFKMLNPAHFGRERPSLHPSPGPGKA